MAQCEEKPESLSHLDFVVGLLIQVSSSVCPSLAMGHALKETAVIL